MRKELVSVIITTYKRPQFLGRCLKSVVDQTHNNIEIIVVDDNGLNSYTEDVTKVVEEIFGLYNINLIKHRINQGVCIARNTGIKKAKGDYIAFLDDDDIWKENKIEEQLEKFHLLSEEFALIYTGVTIVDEVKNTNINQHFHKEGELLQDLLFMNYIGTISSILVKKEVFDAGIFFDPDLKARNDLDFYIELSKQYKVSYINNYSVIKYDHLEETISKNLLKRRDAWYKFYAKHENLYKNNPKANMQYKIGLGHISMMLDKIEAGQFYFKQALLINTFNFKVLPYYISSILGIRFYNFVVNIRNNNSDTNRS